MEHFERAVFDLDLAQRGVPCNVDQVPLMFEIPQRTLVRLAEAAKGRGVVHHRMNVVLRGGAALPGGEDQFQFLDNDTL